MRLKLDENLPHSAALQPAALGFDVDTVLDEHLGGHSDETVSAAAQREQSGAVGESSRDAPLESIAKDPSTAVIDVEPIDAERTNRALVTSCQANNILGERVCAVRGPRSADTATQSLAVGFRMARSSTAMPR